MNANDLKENFALNTSKNLPDTITSIFLNETDHIQLSLQFIYSRVICWSECIVFTVD